ncbi:DNA polymerase III subunit [Bacteroides sp. 519]|uniref:DNA polymerase III subunit n=1 Tax=Bacteroides sp. 519 TaxID=2302937 RepID=UPI0013D0E922|nr:DNA polymerase III subunit [Bacteroides sp. 519]NDV59918.1 DNA polymerase III subunit delta [Bacteroides sp. 519]
MFFRDVIGQDTVKQRLIQEVREGRIPHAQLICGPEGIGKLPVAIAYARYINCQNRGETDACGQCPSCTKFNKLVHPDVHFVFPIIKSAKGKKEVCDDYIAEWRPFVINNPYFNLGHWLNEIDAENSQAIIYAKESDEIIRKLNLKSSEGDYKFVIVWLAEKMHPVCANKLLKLLEEPPAKTIFLLIAEAPDMILTTILSRTQRLNMKKIDDESIAQIMQNKYGIDAKESYSIAHLANGNFIKAMETIHLNEEKQLFFDLFVSLMRLSYQRKIREMKLWSEQVAGMGRERQKNLLDYCQRMIRENFIFNLHKPELVYMTTDENNFATRFAPFINERNVMQLMEELSEAEKHIQQNVNAKMVFFDFALKMIVLLKQ